MKQSFQTSSSHAPFRVDSADDSTGFLLWRVTTLWQRAVKKALEKYEITHPQFVLMASIHWLTLHKQEVTQIVLSNHTNIDPMTTSTVVRALESRHLITREEHATDTRAKTLALTEQGKKIVKQAVKTVEQVDAEFFSSLKKSEHFNKELLALLRAQSQQADV
jgi:MarR family transcriptional regulator, organic hydroperoxide resistance regulator